MWARRTFDSVFLSESSFSRCSSFDVNLVFLHALLQMLVAVAYFVILFCLLTLFTVGENKVSKQWGLLRVPGGLTFSVFWKLQAHVNTHQKIRHNILQTSVQPPATSAWHRNVLLLLYYHVFQHQETKPHLHINCLAHFLLSGLKSQPLGVFFFFASLN